MITIRAIGTLFYRCMVIAFLAISTSNIIEMRLPGHSLNALLMGFVIGILGAFLSVVHRPKLE